MKKLFLFFIFACLAFALFATVASAASVKLEYPFGSLSGSNVTPADYFRALYIWGLGMIAAMAVVGIAAGGFMYMVGKVDQGKEMITSSLLGLLLLMGAWLILYTINPSLATLKNPTLETPGTPPANTQNSNAPGSPGGTPTPQQKTNDFKESGVDDSAQNENLLEKNALSPDNPPLTANGKVSQNTVNYVNNATNLNGVDNARVAAIIQAESSGDTNAVHTDVDGKSSYGLMQIRVGTARDLDPQGTSGLSDSQVADKLTSDPNYNIGLGTQYYSDLTNRYNGDTTLAHAAYNGGPVANNPSVDCPGSTRWQCQWDNTAQTVPNTGYAPTRTYVNNINKYVNSFGS